MILRSLDAGEYAEDIRAVINEMGQPWGSISTAVAPALAPGTDRSSLLSSALVAFTRAFNNQEGCVLGQGMGWLRGSSRQRLRRARATAATLECRSKRRWQYTQ